MKLPEITQPTYSLTLPASGQTIEFRPFLEMERKLLLMALESSDEREMTLAVKKIVTSCSISKVDVNKLSLPDIEYFFLQLRGKSIGEIIPLNFRCENLLKDKNGGLIHTPDRNGNYLYETDEDGNTIPKWERCKSRMVIDVDVRDVTIENLKPVKDRLLTLTPKLKVQMIYPPLISTTTDPESVEYIYEVAAQCIETIYHDEEVYSTKELGLQEIIYFIQHLLPTQFKMIEEFLVDLPTVKKIVEYTCPKCKYEHTITLEGLQSFFA